MKKVIIVMSAFIALVIAFVLTFAGLYISNANFANQAEKGIVAQHDVNKSVKSNYTQRIMEMAQIPTMYKDDLLEVVDATFEGRYGENGSKAVFQFIQENNLQVDSELYGRIQVSIEAGRNEFQANQARLIDMKRQYETAMGYVVQGFFINLAGYPKIDLDKYSIILGSTIEDQFETGIDEKIQLQ